MEVSGGVACRGCFLKGFVRMWLWITFLFRVRNKRLWVVVVAGAFSCSFFPGGCGLASYVSGKSIEPTSALVDGFREEP